MKQTIKLMDEEAKQEIIEIEDKFVKEFVGVWTQWKSWEEKPPMVAYVGKHFAGFLAYSVTKSNYLNIYYVWIDPKFRRLGVAMNLTADVLNKAADAGAKRIKLRCHKDDVSSKYWLGLGFKAIGELGDELFIDEILLPVGVGVVDPHTVTTDKRSLNHYKKLGVKFTHPNWLHLNEA